MAVLVHELWIESEEEQTFCLAGPMGDDARKARLPGARLVWTVDASSHFDAMTKYYEHMNWATYTSGQASDFESYPDEWLRIQRDGS
jgi:hypothetical protein